MREVRNQRATTEDGAFHPEDRSRVVLDGQLGACGWIVQSRDGLNLSAGPGIAIREFGTGAGPTDYGLFVDKQFCGVIEAKPAGTTLSGYADQAHRYISEAPEWLGVDPAQRRFEYVASDTEILFRDHRDPQPRSRRVFAFHRPETLRRWLSEPLTLRARLRQLPLLVSEGLRTCQIEAIQGLETSLAREDPRALIQMTMGAGKTFTACTMSYRLLAHAGARRILFLVDRRNLGNQTAMEYAGYRPPCTGRLFTELYGVQKLGPAGLDSNSAVVISTIQRIYSVLTGKELAEEEEDASAYERAEDEPKIVAYNPKVPIETFDLIVTDECHRSIYGSWRQVLEYFDSFIVGLTATPSIHTLGFFNRNIVAEYPYERSVVDGVNVGYEVYRIRTRIGEQGSRVEKGYTIPVRDKKTRAQRYETLIDDLVYTARELDRSVVAPNQIRTVLEIYRDTVFTDLFPGRTTVPKTVIFAKDDHHAEQIVEIAREVFGKGNDFAKKITYRVTDADPEQLIRQFRIDPNPRIAVTVDMIATGTDVKPIEVLIFLRDVRSELYFEQMKGRGVRSISTTDLQAVTPDADAKTRFILIDAVGVTESAKTLSAPLDRNRTVPFEKLLEQVAASDRRDDTLSTLAARLAALDRRIDEETRTDLAKLAGGRTLADLARGMPDAIDPDSIEAVVQAKHGAAATEQQMESTQKELKEQACAPFDSPSLRQGLVTAKARTDVKIDAISTDEVISSGYDEAQAQKTVDRFKEFLETNKDQIVALQILYGRPYAQRRLTYEALEDLRDALRRPPWLLEPVNIWRAYKRLQDARVRGNPQPKETVHDPACGTGGFLLAAWERMRNHPDASDRRVQQSIRRRFSGVDIVPEVARLCAMNMYLHGAARTENPITRADALINKYSEYDVVLTNPPFGKKQGYKIVGAEGDLETEREEYSRPDFIKTTGNKQLNFLQHIMSILKIDGRCAVVLPDNVLFEAAGADVRKRLLDMYDLHTLLRLPTGIFYKQGVKANVLFFERKKWTEGETNTKELWIYDFRTNQRFTLKERPMRRADLNDFIKCYCAGNRSKRKETERFRKFAYADLIKRDKQNLDIFWLKDDSLDDPDLLPPPDEIAAELVEDLEAALESFRKVAAGLQPANGAPE